MVKTQRILIVGSGVAGLSLAVALRQAGFRPDLIERADDWPVVGAGLYLVGNGTHALQALGLADELAHRAYVIRTQTFCNHRGARLAEIDVAAFWAACGPCLGLERAALHQMLVARVAGLAIRHGLTVTALEQRADDVTVRFSDGAVENYDFVVGADGIRSAVRRLAFGETPPRYCGQAGWRFLAPRPSAITGWTVFLGPGRAFLIVPVATDRVYCYADVTADRDFRDPPDGRLDRLRERFAGFAELVGAVLAQLDPAVPIHFSPIEEVAQPPVGRGRVVLIGDAAHAMSPNMASGAALAVEDALVLASLLAQPGAGPDVSLEFSRRRAPRVNWVRAQTHRRDRTRDLAPALRDAVIRLAGRGIYRSNYLPLLAPLE
jgi:2-polyprenyl-6-methoxyphenol hydroxylase-like FAD-dependent oxidoreductase